MGVHAISAAWEFSRAKASELIVLLAIGDQADDFGVCWPSEELLAARARITARQVRRCIEQLEARGDIEIWTYRRAGESFDRNAYRILLGSFAEYRGCDPEGLRKRGQAVAATLRVPPALRREIFERDGYRCVYCESTMHLTIDHKLPRSRGGGDEPENLQTLCRPCNSSKGAKTDAEHRATGKVVRRDHAADVRRPEDTDVRYARAAFVPEPSKEPSTLSSESARPEVWNPIYDALKIACFPKGATITRREQGQIIVAAKNIATGAGTAEMVPIVVRAYRADTSLSKCALTPLALSNNWSKLAPVVHEAPCDSCGLGGGRHAVGCERIAA